MADQAKMRWLSALPCPVTLATPSGPPGAA